MPDESRKRRRAELAALWATNPERLVSIYLRTAGVKLPKHLPPGAVVARLISFVLDNEPKILTIEKKSVRKTPRA
jgi:hypothetical protein